MSILRNLQTTKCPECGCSIVAEESIELNFNKDGYQTHCNGGRWEHRKFACGYSAQYTPNFSSDEEGMFSKCKKSNAYLEELRKKNENENLLSEFCKSNNLSIEQFSNMKHYL